jgi:hypothetical protein
MIPDDYDPRKMGELFIEDPVRIAKAAPCRRRTRTV